MLPLLPIAVVTGIVVLLASMERTQLQHQAWQAPPHTPPPFVRRHPGDPIGAPGSELTPSWPGDPHWPDDDVYPLPDVIVVESSPAEVLDAFIDQLGESMPWGMRQRMESLARERLSVNEPGYSAIVIPCDKRLGLVLPTPETLNRVSGALAESYEVAATGYPAKWSHPRFGSVELCAVVFHPRGTAPPPRQPVLEAIAGGLRDLVGQGDFVYGAQYGIIDLIVNAFVGSMAGTAGSMTMEGLVRSAGGQKRLNRLARKYKAAMARGDQRAADRIVGKIKKVSDKLQNWDVPAGDIASLIEQHPT